MTEYSAGVLLVEDNLTDVALALRAFKQHNMAHHIQVLRDGVEALEFLLGTGAPKQHNAADAPRVVLLDLKLPLIGGLEVLRQLKANPRTRSRWSSSRGRARKTRSPNATGWARIVISSSQSISSASAK
jgi:two-component system response regulator